MRSPTLTLQIAGLIILCIASSAEAGNKRTKAEIHFESGKQYAQSGLYDQAITKFEQAIAKDSSFALAYMNLGVCYLQKGSDYYPRARRHLEHASRLREGRDDPLVWYNLTAVYSLTEAFDKAFHALDRALALGFKEFDALRTDEDLYELRRKNEFREILEKHRVFL